MCVDSTFGETMLLFEKIEKILSRIKNKERKKENHHLKQNSTHSAASLLRCTILNTENALLKQGHRKCVCVCVMVH